MRLVKQTEPQSEDGSRLWHIGAIVAGIAVGWAITRSWRRRPLPTQQATFYEFVLTALQSGDIVLSTVPLSGTHTLIRRCTKSDFSHAAIYTGNGRALEAHRRPGVTRSSLKNVYIRDLRSVCVLRLSTDICDESGIRQRAVAAAEEYYAAYYSLGGAAFAALPWLPSWTGTRVFCSQLVAAAYSKAGAELVPERRAHKVVPGTLLHSPLLHQITGQVVQAVVGNDLLPHPVLDDGQNTTPHHEEIKLEQAAVHGLIQLLPHARRVATASLLATCESLTAYAIEQSQMRDQLDERALAVLDGSGLLAWYTANLPDQQTFRDIAARARDQMAIVGGAPLLPPAETDWLRQAYFGMPADNQQRRQAWNDYKLLHDASGLTAIRAVIEEYGGFIERMEERQTAIETILQNVLAD